MPVPAKTAAGTETTSNIIVIGHEGHGKTTLAGAIAKVLSTKKKAKSPAISIAEAATSNDKYTKTEISSDKKCLCLFDFVNHAALEEYLANPTEHIEGFLVVVDATLGPEDETKKQLELIQPHIKSEGNLIVFLNKADLAEDAEQIDLVELSVRGLLPSIGLDSEKTLFYRGSASALLESNDRKAQKPILDLMKGVNKLPTF